VADSLDDDLFVRDARTCSAKRASGRRREATSVATGGSRDLAVNAAVHNPLRHPAGR
jgi:hypothetical protein